MEAGSEFTFVHVGDGLAFFRLFGFGLHVKDTRKHRLLPSERYGGRWSCRLGPWRAKVLRRRELTGW